MYSTPYTRHNSGNCFDNQTVFGQSCGRLLKEDELAAYYEAIKAKKWNRLVKEKGCDYVAALKQVKQSYEY